MKINFRNSIAICAASLIMANLSACAQTVAAPPVAAPVVALPATEKKAVPFDLVDVPTRFVLTGNAEEGELSLDTGVSYTANPPFGNPTDPENRRLIDSDKPVVDWTTTTGINAPAQTVTFDLNAPVALSEVALNFDLPQKPASVGVELSESADGPWRAAGTLELEKQTDNWWRLPLQNERASWMRLNFKLKDWGWYLREVKIYGAPIAQVGTPLKQQNKLILADPSGPRAAIVVADRTFLNTLEAAMTFQTLARRRTGALLPIVPASKYDPARAAIFIGDSAAARAKGVTVEQTPFGDDRYVMKTGDNWLALVGNDQRPNKEFVRGVKAFRGSVYAVYDFYERQGCGWYGPDALWQVVPQSPTLEASPLDVTEIPVFKQRDIWMFPLDGQELRSAWRLGGYFVQFGHTYNNLVPPEKYKAEHPEWFGEGQPDITHPEVIRIATENLIAQLDSRPDEPLVSFPVGANDTGGFREPPFKPEVGNNAAQQLYFANEIAKGLRAARPDRHFRLGIYGYWFSHDGPDPMLKGEPEVVVYMVNEGNHAKPLDGPEPADIMKTSARNNTRELLAMENWKQTGRLEGIYEWWIPVLGNAIWKDAPWYDGDTTVRNLRVWKEAGISRLSYESQAEKDAGFPLRWAQYYIGARAMWNPAIDPHQVLLEACGKLFGPAAPTMTSFYELQQTAMRATTERGGNWSLPSPSLIYTPAIEAQGDALLQTAANQLAQLPAADPMRERVAVESAGWKRLKEINVTARETVTKVYKVSLDGKAIDFGQPKISGADLRGLFGVAGNVALEVREFDGQNRPVLPAEEYDLQTGITFYTVKP